MKIRKAEITDLDRIIEIYAYARKIMAENGNPGQWGDNWPPVDVVTDDIDRGIGYVCVNGNDRVVGVFAYLYGKDIEPTYEHIYDGSWKDDSPYGVIHRIAADGSEKGIGRFCISWALANGGHMRIDTHENNKAMQKLLEKLGFEKRGTIYVGNDRSPRIAFEKSEVGK